MPGKGDRLARQPRHRGSTRARRSSSSRR
jgi:hypothetical protein